MGKTVQLHAKEQHLKLIPHTNINYKWTKDQRKGSLTLALVMTFWNETKKKTTKVKIKYRDYIKLKHFYMTEKQQNEKTMDE